ncbi:DEAD/DEAH box helicase [Emticicia sp. BO119]|uniref:DEAD/DEAH box helicase n=1 Tax=Emticicia sp. BO119 TaxID=2757768 RepID=UPI0015F04CA3|nr:DEAD/DEAH box helicase [Emticicia sp. BO119]MBA4853143.1 DEAD/DEAH box helicase [Emticicia sp. BO119]
MAITKSSKSKAAKKTKVENPKKISYYRKPENLTLDQWQIVLRKQFGEDNEHEFRILNLGSQEFFSDFQVTNTQTNNTYKVAIRSADDSQNFCECFDFKTNRLGVCKHISAVKHHLSQRKGFKTAMKGGFHPHYTSVYVDYRQGREIKIRIGSNKKEEFEGLAQTYFNAENTLKEASFGVFELFLEKAAALSNSFRCYPDALDLVIAERDKIRRRDYLWRIMPDGENDKYFDDLIKATLFPYQRKGVFFAALAGKSLIADEMGLGKTLQAIATAELYKRELGIHRVLIVCPTSLKYQWKAEIEKFTDSSVYVIEGSLQKRKDRYWRSDAFYVVVSYHTMTHDLDWLNRMEPDLVILDEAQRIKNWKTKVSQQIKRIVTPYSIVLTGTPLENKLEELYSIMQFIDVYRLGPMYRFLNEHQITDDSGQVIGYKNLNRIAENLRDVLIRRTKKEVLSELPKRMDKNLFVPMTPQQMRIHDEFGDNVAKIVNKWRRFGFLNETDRKRLVLALSQMRMVCDSTYILDQKTRYDTKIDEVMNILDEVFETSDEKVVIFSQWERMTRLVAHELEQKQIKFEYLYGGVESIKRKDLLENFQNNPESKVFLSTDAGGVGLNLQNASLLINLDIPWNPAVLEQRIARIYRLGQEKNVSIINLISSGTIEERMLDVLRFKGAMAKGVLDGGEDTIFVGEDQFRQFMDSVENLVPQEVATTETIDSSESEEETIKYELPDELLVDKPEAATTFMGDDDVKETNQPSGSGASTDAPPQELIHNGINFFAQLGKTLKNPEATKELIESIMQKDDSGKVYLKIPIENEEVINNAVQALSTLFGAFMKQ